MSKKMSNSMKAFSAATVAGLFLTFGPALSDSFSNAQAGGNGPQTKASQISAAECPSHFALETGQSVKYLQARAASNDGKIVLHYGDGIDGADSVGRVLGRRNYPIIAVSGGPKGAVRVFINGKSAGHKFTQDEINMGTLGGVISSAYDELVDENAFARPKCDVVAGLVLD